MSFVIGDRVELDAAQRNKFMSLTYYTIYRVVHVSSTGKFIRLTNNLGNDVNYRADLFVKFIPVPASTAPRATVKAHPYLDSESVDEDTYEARKANARVTSAGLFSVGTRLVYEDGTPTLTSLTVKRCTATSVWFEETYSTPFNPDEFEVEYTNE